MFLNVNRALTISLQTFCAKNVTTGVGSRRLQYLQRLLYTQNIDYVETKRQNTSERHDLELSPDETQTILEKINRSSQSELLRYDFISTKSAAAIVEYRHEFGKFSNISDILKLTCFKYFSSKRLTALLGSVLSLTKDQPNTPEKLTLQFTPKETEIILNKFNENSESEFAEIKSISTEGAHVIINHRSVHGQFNSFDDLLKIPLLQIDMKLPKICQGILSMPKEKPADLQDISLLDTEMILHQLNTLSSQELADKSLGGYLSESIVEYRKTHGLLKQIDDLKKIHGIGLKKAKWICHEFGAKGVPAEFSPQEETQTAVDKLKLSSKDNETILEKLNNSPAYELMQFTSISRDTANAIVTRRRENGLFTSVDDILNIVNSDHRKLAKICRNILSAPNTIITISADFSAADIQSILQTLNNSSPKELANKKVGKQLSELIVKYRDKNGLFERLEGLLAVQRIGPKKLKQLCQGMLAPNLKPVSEYGHSMERLQSVQDLVTIDIGLKHIAWLHMTRDKEVLQWTVNNIDQISPAKWEPQTYFNVVKEVVSQLPTIDFYIIEHQPNIGSQIANKNMLNTFIYIRALEALFLGLLNADVGQYGNLGAASVSRNVVARQFDLMVGLNRASTQPLVQKMLQDQEIGRSMMYASSLGGLTNDDTNPSNAGTSQFMMDEHVARVFHSSSSYQREHLANCLLQAVFFFETVK